MDESWRLSRDEALRQRDEARLWVERLQEEVRLAEAQVRGLQEQIEAKDAQLHFLRREIDGMEAEVAALVSANKETAE
jgi:chromosome segregation ATPase